jgi:hypothetical protein
MTYLIISLVSIIILSLPYELNPTSRITEIKLNTGRGRVIIFGLYTPEEGRDEKKQKLL